MPLRPPSTSRVWQAILWVGALAFTFDVGTLVEVDRPPFVPPAIVLPMPPVPSPGPNAIGRPIRMPQYLGPDNAY